MVFCYFFVVIVCVFNFNKALYLYIINVNLPMLQSSYWSPSKDMQTPPHLLKKSRFHFLVQIVAQCFETNEKKKIVFFFLVINDFVHNSGKKTSQFFRSLVSEHCATIWTKKWKRLFFRGGRGRSAYPYLGKASLKQNSWKFTLASTWSPREAFEGSIHSATRLVNLVDGNHVFVGDMDIDHR